MTIIIELTIPELMQASTAGSVRRVTSIKEGYNKNKHAEKSDWQTDIDGAGAEMAFAKKMNLYWSASNRSFKEPDVATWQVRSTSHPGGHLLIRPNDEDIRARYVLVITNPPFFTIVGYKTAASARVDHYWRQDSWWVPQADLIEFQCQPTMT